MNNRAIDLLGIHVDRRNGHRRSMSQRAKYKHSERYPLITHQETNAILTEMTFTEIGGATRHVHRGWLISTSSTMTPWILTGIESNNHLESINDKLSIAKRDTLQQLLVRVTLDILGPLPSSRQA